MNKKYIFVLGLMITLILSWVYLVSNNGMKRFLSSSASSITPILTTGAAQLVDPFQDSMGRTMDLPPVTLRKNATEFYTWTNNGENSFRKYKGTVANPLATMLWSDGISVSGEMTTGRWDFSGITPDYGTPRPSIPRYRPWLGNIYKVPNTNTLIGFVHIETGYWRDMDYRFRIGIAISRDEGENWKYLGDVLKPKYDEFSNMGGTPLLIVKDKVNGVDTDFFYLYFNEMPVGGPRIPAVARAKVSDVVNAAVQSNTVTPWVKYNRNTGGWVENGKTGLASNITWNIDNETGLVAANPTYPDRYDMHTDAVYSTALDKYILLAWEEYGYDYSPPSSPTDPEVRRLNKGIYMYTSENGIDWGDRRHIFTPPNTTGQHPYAFFAGGLTHPDTTDDFNVIGGDDFYIYFPDRINNGLYRIPFHVDGGVTSTTANLTISKTGLGNITLPATGTSCGTDCYTYNKADSTIVTLSAVAGSGYTFTSWSGCDSTSGTGGEYCTVNMSSSNKNVHATFSLPGTSPIPVIASPTVNQVFPSNTSTINLEWNTVSEASGYQLRVIEYTDATKTTQTTRRYAGNTNSASPFYVYIDNRNSTSLTSLPVDPGRHYRFWIHSVIDGVVSDGKDVFFSVESGPTIVPKTLTVSTSGQGTISSTPTGINCGSDCSESYSANESITLNAVAATGYTFSGWSGACSGTNICSVSMTENRTVIATFTAIIYTLTTSVVGQGNITGNSSPYNSGTTATITAIPSSGYTFTNWSGGCAGTNTICTLTMNSNKNTTATFTAIPTTRVCKPWN